jgi:HlyD family secretion protein
MAGASRALGYAVVGVGVAAALVYAFWPEPVAVDLAPVSRAAMMVTIDEDGETRVKDVYVVSAPLSGRIDRIEVEVGDAVHANQTILATLQESEPSLLDLRSRRQAEAAVRAAEAASALAEAERDRARAELDYAEAEWGRAQALAERGTISQAALDRARLERRTHEAVLATTEAALRVRLSELDNARAELIDPGGSAFDQPAGSTCCIPVLAPVDGRVLRVLRKSEGVVVSGEPLIEIGDARDLEVVTDLLSADAVKVAPGARVLIEDWGGEGVLEGTVRQVEPYGFTKVSALGIEEQRVNVVIDLADPPERWRALGHGYRVEARIVVWHADSVLGVPLGALFRRGEAWAVFVAEAGRARLRTVSLGHLNRARAEVLDGLAEGEMVVLHPSDRVGEGTRITERSLDLRR